MEHFGVGKNWWEDQSNSEALRTRLWARLVEKVSGMDFDRTGKGNIETLTFYKSAKEPFVVVEIIKEFSSEGTDFRFLVSKPNGEVMAQEESITYFSNHPLREILDLIGNNVESGQRSEIKNLSRLISG